MCSPDPSCAMDLNLNHLKAADVFATHAVASGRRSSEDDPAILKEINEGQMLVLAALKETKMAWRDEERSLISSFNKEQRKYGTTSTYVKKPERFITYEVQPGDTLQGISLKHNVTMEQLKRANKLWTNDSLALRRTLLVPVPLEAGAAAAEEPAAAVLSTSTSLDSLHSSSSCSARSTRTNGVHRSGSQTELDRSEQSASDFLSNIDSVIASSRRNVKKLETCQPLSEADEDVLYVRPTHSRLRHQLYPAAGGGADPAAVPATAVRGARQPPAGQRRSDQRHTDIFEL